MKEEFKFIGEMMVMAQSRQKSYDGMRKREMTFQEGYRVDLKVLPMKRVKGLS